MTGRVRGGQGSTASKPKPSSSSTRGKKDYAAIAAAKITTPRQISEKAKAEGRTKPKRILIYSRNKKGKTTLCASAPNVIIADPEEGGFTWRRSIHSCIPSNDGKTSTSSTTSSSWVITLTSGPHWTVSPRCTTWHCGG